MLSEARDLQKKVVKELIEKLYRGPSRKEFTFKAPTGSGKTYMMADFISQVIKNSSDVIFVVSSLSKAGLAVQNYDKFLEYKNSGRFSNLDPYLITSSFGGEGNPFIPNNHNVYFLPIGLTKAEGILSRGVMTSFFSSVISGPLVGGLNKRIFLIRDECHIATNNLKKLDEQGLGDYFGGKNSVFSKIFNFSATPNLGRGQYPDVEMKEEDAERVKLIKRIVFDDEEHPEGVEIALRKLDEIKPKYNNLLGVNPCLIIQIDNKEKADEEIEDIKEQLSKHQRLKWMIYMSDESKCETNDMLQLSKYPKKKWKDYAKGTNSLIDVIIFKLSISEGWDIPRACMLYQVRDSKSKQLDEQVLGRIRRNPRLMDFESLSKEAQELSMTCWAWGILPQERTKVHIARLKDKKVISENLCIKTTVLQNVIETKTVNFDDVISASINPNVPKTASIFELYRKVESSSEDIKVSCYNYASTYQKFYDFALCLDQISSSIKAV